ncbi:unnamed protein product [Caenorhabditis auriculariae]|uniref:Uncharacterized protein n=1 Tax=Caenorhabditis auriculariae TaxID=2777116 RepID=A0A8S1H3S2_9PELO|nr:unnamed protein product [Caenorhabditis auriculariae]
MTKSIVVMVCAFTKFTMEEALSDQKSAYDQSHIRRNCDSDDQNSRDLVDRANETPCFDLPITAHKERTWKGRQGKTEVRPIIPPGVFQPFPHLLPAPQVFFRNIGLREGSFVPMYEQRLKQLERNNEKLPETLAKRGIIDTAFEGIQNMTSSIGSRSRKYQVGHHQVPTLGRNSDSHPHMPSVASAAILKTIANHLEVNNIELEEPEPEIPELRPLREKFYLPGEHLKNIGVNPTELTTPLMARTANGSTVFFLGVITLNVTAGNTRIQHAFKISRDNDCPAQALLGIDFIQAIGQMTFDLKSNCLHIGDEKLQLNMLIASEDTSKTDIGNDYCENPQQQRKWRFENNLKPSDDIYAVGRCLVRTDEEENCVVKITLHTGPKSATHPKSPKKIRSTQSEEQDQDIRSGLGTATSPTTAADSRGLRRRQ